MASANVLPCWIGTMKKWWSWAPVLRNSTVWRPAFRFLTVNAYSRPATLASGLGSACLDAFPVTVKLPLMPSLT